MKIIKEDKFTLKQHINLIFRGLKIFAAFPKSLILSKTVSVVFNSAIPFINIYFSAQILNELAGAKNQKRLIFLVLLTIGLNFLSIFIRSVIGRWAAYCDSATGLSMHKIYTDKFLAMDYADIENPEIQHQFSKIREHQTGMGFGLPRLLSTYDGLISGAIQLILSVVMAFSLFTLKVPAGSRFAYLDSPFAVIALILVLSCSVFIAPYLSVIGGKVWPKASNINNDANRAFGFYYFDMIRGSDRAKDIRIYDQKHLIDASTGISEEPEGIREWLGYVRYNARFNAFSTALSYLANGLIYLFVALKAFAGAFGIGGIVQYVGAITQFSGGLASILTNIGTLVNNNPFLDKVLTFLDIPNKKYQGTISVEKRDDNEYEIEFKNVSFKYPDTDTYALKNLNLKFNIGQRMAVVGMNGSGKTTMIKLLCRLYDPTEGIITLNGVDIRKYNYDEYMALFSVVFQDFKLLPFTLSQNVAASVNYDSEKVLQSLSKSGFDARLENMPKGIETYLYKDFEEDGVEISGGEAQKIALARALYKDAPFTVLDEPTAALDPIAEFEVYSKFNEIVGGKTAIYISHRLSSCRFCDDIAVFHEGELIQRGSHDTLIADERGKYHELWNAQAQYYQENKESNGYNP
ncbi:MAG: ABC transporter ATP-binding protein/permease [Oscillospiraceae bacterium]|nr:ABC transporter ATP-binding protein/permease [Oscillospiraceae bacterium]